MDQDLILIGLVKVEITCGSYMYPDKFSMYEIQKKITEITSENFSWNFFHVHFIQQSLCLICPNGILRDDLIQNAGKKELNQWKSPQT